jgi:hypothetical protein
LNPLALIPLITSCFYLILLAFALQKAVNRVRKLFFYYLGVAAFWSFTSFMVHLNQTADKTLVWNEILIIALVWTLVAYYHFTIGYTNRRHGPILYVAYLSLIPLAIASISGNVVKFSYVVDGVTHYELYPLFKYFLLIVGVSLSAFVIFLLGVKYRHSSDVKDRNRTMYLFMGWGLLVLFTLSNYVPAFANYPLDHVGNLLNALVISYAISQ